MKKLLRILIAVLVIFMAGYVGLNFFVKHKIKTFLEEEVKTGNLHYADFNLELWSGNFRMDTLAYTFKQGRVSADRIAVEHISYWAYVLGGTISIESLQVTNPDMHLALHSVVDKEGHRKKARLDFDKQVKIENFSFTNGDFLLKKDSLTTLKIKDYTLFFKALKATPQSLKEQIPFLFDDVMIQGGRLDYRLNADKSLVADSLDFTNHKAVVHGVSVNSNDELQAYLNDSLRQHTWVDMTLDRLEINNYKFELSDQKKQLKSSSIAMDGLCSTLYKNKRTPEDTLNLKTGDSSFLARLPLKFDVDTVRMSHVEVDYRELHKAPGTNDLEDQPILQLQNYFVAVYGSSIGKSQGKTTTFPFSYKDFTLIGDRGRYRLNALEVLQVDSLDIKTHRASVFHPQIVPKLGRSEFTRQKTAKPNWIKADLKTVQLFDYQLNVQSKPMSLTGAKIKLEDLNFSLLTDQRSSGKKEEKSPTPSAKSSPFTFRWDTLEVNQVNWTTEALTRTNKKQTLVKLEDYNLRLYDFKSVKKDTIGVAPFTMKDFALNGKSLHYHLNTLQDIKIDSMQIKQHDVWVHHLRLTPNYNRWNYVRVIPYEKDLMDIDLKTLHLADFKLDLEVPYGKLTGTKLTLDTVTMDVFRDKRVRDDPTPKKLYSGMLRTMKLNLKIDTLQVSKADVTYEELQEKTGKTGKVFFKNMNVLATDITNLNLKRADFPTTKVDISTRFMGRSPLHVGWTFRINDPLDRFRIYGDGSHIPPVAINSFLTPAFNIRALGDGIDQLHFDFRGNRTRASGNFKMVYKNLKIEVLKNDTGKRRGFLSFVGNLVMHKKRGKDREAVHVGDVKRDNTKSFWNYLWKCVFAGLNETLVF